MELFYFYFKGRQLCSINQPPNRRVPACRSVCLFAYLPAWLVGRTAAVQQLSGADNKVMPDSDRASAINKNNNSNNNDNRNNNNDCGTTTNNNSVNSNNDDNVNRINNNDSSNDDDDGDDDDSASGITMR